MDYFDACEQFIIHCLAEKGLQKQTIVNYNDDLKKRISYKLGNIELVNSIVNGTVIFKDSVFRKFKFDEIDVAGNIIEDNINYVDLDNIETANILRTRKKNGKIWINKVSVWY